MADEPRSLPTTALATIEGPEPSDIFYPGCGPDSLLAFVDPGRYSAAFDLAGWTPETEVATLTDLARTGSPRIRLAAVERLHAIAFQALTASGRISQVHASATDESGHRLTLTTQRVATAIEAARLNPLLMPVSQTPTPQEITDDPQRLPEPSTDHIHRPPVHRPYPVGDPDPSEVRPEAQEVSSQEEAPGGSDAPDSD